MSSMMDSTTRRAILAQVTKSSPALREAQGIKESPSEPTRVDKVFEYRRQLKKIKEFESKWKTDAEEWSDAQWKDFDKAMHPTGTMNMLESMLEKRELREKAEADQKKELRNKILEKVNFGIIGKL